ncbi:hypothetical protein MMC26_003064 [Xylographa opegraphella]|nr:hypothetical protein [Xylographa opegraphella]
MAGPVRQPVNIECLSSYLEQNIPEIRLPISIKQFGFGQSNPTYQLTAADDVKYVLRKKPPGKLLSKTAHQVEREYRIIHALGKTNVPVPKTYGLCEDASVVGTPFYIMEFLDGRIFEDASFPGVTAAERREMWRSALLTLSSLHCTSPASASLSSFGKPSGFYNRQLKTLGTISIQQAQAIDIETGVQVGKIPHFDDMVAFFRDPETQPRDMGTLIHGDYKIDNLVYHKTEPRVIGILDWEMSTIGHPLSDLANILGPYTLAQPQPQLNTSAKNPFRPLIESRTNPAFLPNANVPGLPSRDECIAIYAEAAGWDPRPKRKNDTDESLWGDAFGVFRNSVIMQGIAARYALRQASSAQAQEIGALMRPFGEAAWALVDICKGGTSNRYKARL